MRKLIIGFAVVATVTLSPASDAGPTADSVPVVGEPATVTHELGVASWYGERFHGNPTASGEPYDMNGLTAAHRELPMGTRIIVTNLKNHRAVTLRVNDRGPNIPGRMLDVSKAAARSLGFLNAGLANVRLEVLPKSKLLTAPKPAAAASVAF